jgi:phospholipase C
VSARDSIVVGAREPVVVVGIGAAAAVRPRRLLLALGAILGALALTLAGVEDADGQTGPAPNTPIQHFVVLMQQNRSFDHYFGTYPGADRIPSGTCMPIDPSRSNSKCIKPFNLGSRAIGDLAHSRGTFAAQYRRGGMNGFIDANRRTSGRVDPTVMGYYDGEDIPYYWNVADEYVLFDRFFASSPSGSVRNAMYWVTGTPGNYSEESIPAGGFGELETIFDRLQARDISWKFYVQNYNPGINFRNRGSGERSSQVAWVPPLAYDRYLRDPKLRTHIVDLEEYFEDLQSGDLPSVSYIVAPSGGSSEHPPAAVKAGQRFVAKLVNALMRSEHWSRSAFMWTYDGWGGWYDHVKPPRADRFGYGFRVPALLVSPYAKRGHIESTTLDFTSILKFVERNWDLEPLASRDRKARSIAGAFDFNQAPREPRFPASERGGVDRREPNRVAIYGAYMGAMVLTGFVIVWAVLGRNPLPLESFGRRRPRRQNGRRPRR